MTTPVWQAATPGYPAMAGAVNQFLISHQSQLLYQGALQASQAGGSGGGSRGQIATPLNATNGGLTSWAANPAAGSKVLVGVICGTAETITSVVDNGSAPTTFTLDAHISANSNLIGIYRGDSISLPASGPYAVTVGGSGGHVVSALGIAYTGYRTGAPTATSTGSAASGSSVATGNATPASAGALFFAAFGDVSGILETISLTNTTFTEQFVQNNGVSWHDGAIADKIDLAGPTATQCLWTASAAQGWAAVIAAYDAASTPSPASSDGLWLAQKFTAGASQTTIGYVQIYIGASGSPSPWSISVQADNGSGAPNGTALAATLVPKEAAIGGWVTVLLPVTGLTPSGVYWIVAQAQGDATDYFVWDKSNQVSGASTSINGTSWTTQSYGLLFQVWDATVTGNLTGIYDDNGARWTVLSYTGSTVTGIAEWTAGQLAAGYTWSSRTLSYSGGLLTGVT